MEQWAERVEALEIAVQELSQNKRTTERKLRLWRGAVGVLAAAALTILPLRSGKAQGSTGSLSSRVAFLEQRVAKLEQEVAALQNLGTSNQPSNNPTGLRSDIVGALNAHLAVKPDPATGDKDNLVFTGINMHIRSAFPRTDTTDGTGNLIVGWNDGQNADPQHHAGSNNIVVGAANEYSRFGGLVVGENNQILGPYASVTGGQGNKAYGPHSSISGEAENSVGDIAPDARSDGGTISGGSQNHVNGRWGLVTGGNLNFVNGDYAVVSGGGYNHADAQQSWIGGGNADQTMSGGTLPCIVGGDHDITGGQANYSMCVGGHGSDTSMVAKDNNAPDNHITVVGSPPRLF